MSYPLIGGKLRDETSGVDRSQAGSVCWGLDPVKEIGQTCGLNVIVRRLATSNRSMVTAAKIVYSTWKIKPPGERCQGKVEMSCSWQSRNVAFSLDLQEVHVNLRVPVKRRRAMLASNPIKE